MAGIFNDLLLLRHRLAPAWAQLDDGAPPPPERSEWRLYIGLMENFLIDWAQSIGDTFSEIKSTCLVSQFPVAFIIIVIN